MSSCGVVLKKAPNSQPPRVGSHSCTRTTTIPAARAARTCNGVQRGVVGCSGERKRGRKDCAGQKVQHIGASRHLIGQLAPCRAEPRLLVQVEHEESLVFVSHPPQRRSRGRALLLHLDGYRVRLAGVREPSSSTLQPRTTAGGREYLGCPCQRRQQARADGSDARLLLDEGHVGWLGAQVRVLIKNLLPRKI
eukprot:scaffold40627_cov67-Phaeocystis_antarctica.AAC.4